MCGRFTREYTWAELHELMSVWLPSSIADGGPAREAASAGEQPPPAQLGPSYNVAPTQASCVVVAEPDSRGLLNGSVRIMHWGFEARFAGGSGKAVINARGETADTKPMFKDAFAKRRCIVPISSFYEWQTREDGSKRPWRIVRKDGGPQLLAGLWTLRDQRDRDHGAPGASFTIVTTAADAFMSGLHPRMPAAIAEANVPRWCDPRTPISEAKSLLTGVPRETQAKATLEAHPVSRRVNSPKNNDPSLIDAVEEAPLEAKGEEDGQPTLWG
jgi:putative SOS response-associated peptidase YedK